MEELEQIRLVVIDIGMNDEPLDLRNRRELDPNFVLRVLLLNNERLLEGVVEVVLEDGRRDLQRGGLVELTDRGHEFLNAVRDRGDWRRVIERLRANGHDIDTVALAVVVDTAME